jgi:hypothetical protein
MEYNISIRMSLTQKRKLRDYIGQSKNWGMNLTLGLKLRA